MTRSRISILVTISILVAMVLYLRASVDLWETLRQLSWGSLIALVFLRIGFLGTNGLFLRAFMQSFGVTLTGREWFGLSIVTTMGNYLVPFSGGLFARAAYLKRRHDFPYTQFLILLSSNYLVNFWVVGLTGIVLSIMYLQAEPAMWLVSSAFASVFVIISLLIAFPSFRLPESFPLAEKANLALMGWETVRYDTCLLVRLIIFTTINISLNAISFWIAYRSLGTAVTFLESWLVSLMTAFSVLVNITPANLGIQEAFIGFSTRLIGADTGMGLLTGFLIRTTTIIPVFVLGPVFSYLLTQEAALHEQHKHMQ